MGPTARKEQSRAPAARGRDPARIGPPALSCVSDARPPGDAWTFILAACMDNEGQEKVLDSNRHALHLFEIEDRYEAGVALAGTEVKSLRAGGSNLRDAFARINRNEAFIYNWRIAPYSHGNLQNHDPLRIRKLLLHKSEIRKLIGATRTEGRSLVPLRVYLRDGRIKLELGLGRGRKVHDKREAIKKREMKREADRARATRGRED